MSSITTQQAIQQAMHHHSAGQFQQAEAMYRQVLAQEPQNVDALHLLGVLAYQVRQYQPAVELISRAIAINPHQREFYNHLGNALQDQGKLNEAVAVYRKALELDPKFAEVHSNLGNALKMLGRLDEAIVFYRAAVAANPAFAEGFCNLGVALGEQWKLDEAIEAYRAATALKPGMPEGHSNLSAALGAKQDFAAAARAAMEAVRLRPNYPEAHNNLANALKGLFQLEEAAAAYRRAIAIAPAYVDAQVNLGIVLREMGKLDEAADAFRIAIRHDPRSRNAHLNLGNTLKDQHRPAEAVVEYRAAIAASPRYAEAYNNLGVAYHDLCQLGDAIDAYRQCIAMKPEFSEVYNNLANALSKQGRMDEAIAAYRESLRLKPSYAAAEGNLLYVEHFRDGLTRQQMFEAHRQWSATHADHLFDANFHHANDRSPERRLRIGYVSADMRDHPVGRFLLPLIDHHNREQVEIFCYSGVVAGDEITRLLQAAADGWREVGSMPDAMLAEEIRRDRIDILIDLAGHTSHNRLLTFARKPAPLQVSYLGYPDTTGMSAIDYRITDRFADPPDEGDEFYSEKLVRFDQNYLCYSPGGTSPDVGPLPSEANGHITFGSFNSFSKVSPRLMQTWAKLLNEVPRARLLIKSLTFGDEVTCRIARTALIEAGISADRFDVVSPKAPFAQHLEVYRQVDIALDTFPYNGTTTTCEALGMGVPVITLNGENHAGRMGASILTTIGLNELIATDENQYVRIAAALASDREMLKELRTTLRFQLSQSPIGDASRLASTMESAFRQMWRRWCAGEMPITFRA